MEVIYKKKATGKKPEQYIPVVTKVMCMNCGETDNYSTSDKCSNCSWELKRPSQEPVKKIRF